MAEHGLTPCRIDQGTDFSLKLPDKPQLETDPDAEGIQIHIQIQMQNPKPLGRTDVLVRDWTHAMESNASHRQEHSSLSCRLKTPCMTSVYSAKRSPVLYTPDVFQLLPLQVIALCAYGKSASLEKVGCAVGS